MLWSKAFLAGHDLNTVTHVTVGTNGNYGLMPFEDEMYTLYLKYTPSPPPAFLKIVHSSQVDECSREALPHT